MKKIINWFKMQWAIFQYTDSVEATNGNSPQWKVDEKIKQIKGTFIPNKGASRTESPTSDLTINHKGRTKSKFEFDDAKDYYKAIYNTPKVDYPNYNLTIDDFDLSEYGYTHIKRIYDGFWIILAQSEQDYINKVRCIDRGDRKGFLTINRAKRKA